MVNKKKKEIDRTELARAIVRMIKANSKRTKEQEYRRNLIWCNIINGGNGRVDI